MDNIENGLKGNKEIYIRFGLNFRIQHIILLTSTVILIISGLPLKFSHSGWAKFIMNLLGGSELARQFHHLGALGLIFIGLYHLAYSIFFKVGRKDFYLLLPRKKDFVDLITQILYYLRKSKEKAKFGRFSYIEKFDYWAVYWGFVIMIGSGIIMWLFQGKFQPLFFGIIDLSFGTEIVNNYIHAIAREAHSDEALLATLAIVIWHFYNVHLNPHKFPMSKVWLTGMMTKNEMFEEHPLELEEILKNKEKKENESTVKKNITEDDSAKS
jgi:cytochrome b subunit of formate dehydrogenase